MPRLHQVRYGSLGMIGGFVAADATRYGRGTRVVLRSDRGLELGQVLSPPEGDDPEGETAGLVLRAVTPEDELLEARLQKNRDRAYEACAAKIAEHGLPAALMDVEQLFDGQTLAFYFLGETTPELTAITDELAEAYEAQAQIRKFAETLLAGCGPDCGTGEAGGCGSCATGCAVADACGVRGRAARAP
jgi:cell fate regulator YaaT (PSP1 superfamily)